MRLIPLNVLKDILGGNVAGTDGETSWLHIRKALGLHVSHYCLNGACRILYACPLMVERLHLDARMAVFVPKIQVTFSPAKPAMEDSSLPTFTPDSVHFPPITRVEVHFEDYSRARIVTAASNSSVGVRVVEGTLYFEWDDKFQSVHGFRGALKLNAAWVPGFYTYFEFEPYSFPVEDVLEIFTNAERSTQLLVEAELENLFHSSTVSHDKLAIAYAALVITHPYFNEYSNI